MKKLIPKILLAALSLLAAPVAQAQTWTYNDGDLLLIFRKSGFSDVEFDLGSVTNYLGKTNGYTTTVTGWDLSLVTSTPGYSSNLKNANVILLATSGQTAANQTVWLTSSEPNTTAYNVSGSQWSALSGVISAIGNKPVYYNVADAEANAYVIDPGDVYAAASYDSVVSDGFKFPIAQLGGKSPFTVQQAIPGILDFWAVKPTGIYPNSPADQLVGTFTTTTNGVLKFIAGPRPSSVTGVTRAGNISTVQFTTTVGNTYSLAYTNKLGGAAATWPVDSVTVTGDGNADFITHTNTGNAEFYRVTAQ